ncbi:hypothetical protein M2G64_21580 [Vibrio vulnificus]|nr:hypothetical protein [Vibrio vulnificus]MCU8116109.1 hypothetical protein [Vibrio vulnificus]MCU8309005.1 hypothetical protein [Vibrio vulnificus]
MIKLVCGGFGVALLTP